MEWKRAAFLVALFLLPLCFSFLFLFPYSLSLSPLPFLNCIPFTAPLSVPSLCRSLGVPPLLIFFYNLSLLGYGLFVSATSSRSGFLFFLCFNSLFFPFQFIRVGEDPR